MLAVSLAVSMLLSSTHSLDIKWVPSPNKSPRPHGTVINTLVIHHTAMDSYESALQKLTDGTQANPVSSHYLIGKDGTIAQLVDLNEKAWHAGVSSWLGHAGVNDFSIGIELDNTGFEPFSAELMASLKALTSEIVKNFTITNQRVVGH